MIIIQKRLKRTFILLTIFSIVSVILLGNINLNRQHSSFNQSYYELEEHNSILRFSGMYTDITIDDSPGSLNNWAWAKTQPWCSGSGTILEPYLIEDHNIKMYLLLHGIRIINSHSSYFTIRDCNITWDTSQTNTLLMTGIFLSNTTNGQIINNTIYHLGKGIHLNHASNMQIVNNTIYDHPQEGILSENSDFIDITGNEIYDNNNEGVKLYNATHGQIKHNNFSLNAWDGFLIDNCSNLAISSNIAHNNTNEGFSIDNSTLISFTENTAYFNDIGIWIDDMSYSNFTENTIYNNSLSEWGNGVKFGDDCIFLNVSENTIFNNSGNGIDIEDRSYNNTISNNDVSNNADNGIEIDKDCINNSVFGNEIYENLGDGIYVFNSSYNYIFDNEIFNNTESGIYVNVSDNNLIYDNLIRSNEKWGITIVHSGNNSIKDNEIEHNTLDGIRTYYCNYTQIMSNNVNNNSHNGVDLDHSINSTILGNSVNFNLKRGFELMEAFGNVIMGNTGTNQQDYGILLMNSDDNELDENIFIDNEYGIGLSDSHYNKIRENKINGSTSAGISLYESNNSIVLNNVVRDNPGNGIEFEVSHYNAISENSIYNNTAYGVYLFEECTNNNITGNIIRDNENGICFRSPTFNNLIWENLFLKNGKHAVDEGSNNNWNITIIGNYWDNWTSPDVSPNDGIVDVPYNISGPAGSKDYLPIAEDGAPSITINSPGPGDIFDSSTPSFNVRITDDYLNEMWYTIDGGLTNYTFSANETIYQTAWDGTSEGIITLTFYANDIIGHIGTAEVIIVKDFEAPLITINSPDPEDVFGSTAPSFSVRITDDYLDTMWYTLDGGLNNFTFLANETIGQAAWDGTSEGNVTLTFYANDTLGHIGSAGVIIIKDTVAPIIIINSPNPGEVFGNNAPSFNVTITDLNLESMWLVFEGVTLNLVNPIVGTINDTVWSELPDGDYTITFYANDTVGHTTSEAITITKSVPSIPGIGLDYFMTSFLIFIMGGLVVVVIVAKIHLKNR